MASNFKWLTRVDVVEKTVKDILQSMVSEGIVQSDKIGTSNCMSCLKVKANLSIERSPSLLGVSICSRCCGMSMVCMARMKVLNEIDISTILRDYYL